MHFKSIAAAAIIAATSFGSTGLAQETGAVDGAPVTNETEVLGQSGNADYPLRVLGQNGNTYFCRDFTQVVDGVTVRPCRSVNAAGQLTGGLSSTSLGLTAGEAFALVGTVLVSLAIAGDSTSQTAD